MSVDLETLPPDAVRLQDEIKVVQGIEIKPKKIQFQRHVYDSAAEKNTIEDRCPTIATKATSARACELSDYALRSKRALAVAIFKTGYVFVQ